MNAVRTADTSPSRQVRRWKTFLTSSQAEFLIVACLLATFLALQFAYPRMPGMTSEGLLKSQFRAGQILELLREGRFIESAVRGWLPSADNHYHGALMAYLYVPFLWAFGPNWYVAKYWPTFFAMFTLLFMYFFARNTFGKTVGLIALALVIIHPSYVMGVRIGASLDIQTQFFSMGTMYFLSRAWTLRSRRSLFLAAGLVGLGLSDRLWFAWFPASLLGCALIFRRDIIGRFRLWKKGRLWHWMRVGLGGLAAGSVFLIYREIIHPFESFTAISRLVLSRDNPDRLVAYPWNFLEALRLFNSYLSGESLFNLIFWFRPGFSILTHSSQYYPGLFWLGAFLLFTGKARSLFGKRAIFGLALFAGMLALAPVGRHPLVHIVSVYPWPQLILACGFAVVFRFLKDKWLLIGLLLSVGIAEVRCLSVYYQRLGATGGARMMTDTIYSFSQWLKIYCQPGTTLFQVLEPRMGEYERHLYFLIPDNRFDYIYAPENQPLAAFRGVERQLKKGEKSLLWIKPRSYEPNGDSLESPANRVIEEWLRDNGIPFRRVARFEDDDGVPTLEVDVVGRKGVAFPDGPVAPRF